MNDVELGEELRTIFDNANADLAERLVAYVKERFAAQAALDLAVVTKMIDDSGVVRQLVYDHFKKHVENEVGNRLRCGIYNGLGVDKLFESIWTEQLDVSLKDRIRQRAYKVIDEVIAERLKGLK